MDHIDFCGIEISAEKLAVLLRREGVLVPLREFPNNPAGHQAIVGFLGRPGRLVQVCLESTGRYGLDLSLALSYRREIQVMVANPRAVRHFAAALMERNKNDRIDALVLLEFAARMPFQAWRPPSPARLALHALARRLEDLTAINTAEKNRLHAALLSKSLPAAVARDLRRSIHCQERAIARLTGEALRVIAGEPELQLRFELLCSADGIGEASAVRLLAELAVLSPDLGVRQWVASAGLDPREYPSGSSVRKQARISKAGNRHRRRALYMPALVAARYQPHLHAFYEHLLARGKTKLQALVAVMRKLLHAIYGLFKHRQPFDGSKVYRTPTTVARSQANLSPAEAA